jgi:hypothetical protein
MEVFEVHVITRNPSGNDPLDKGSVEIGFYTVEGKTVTLTDATGVPLRSKKGALITAPLAPDANVKQVASRLKLAHWRNERAESDEVPGFNSPIRYPSDRGWK